MFNPPPTALIKHLQTKNVTYKQIYTLVLNFVLHQITLQVQTTDKDLNKNTFDNWLSKFVTRDRVIALLIYALIKTNKL